MQEDDEHPDDAVVRKIAWTLFAGPDATYRAGEYVPSQDELDLASKFLVALRADGYDIVQNAVVCGWRWHVRYGMHGQVEAVCDQRGEHEFHEGFVTTSDPFTHHDRTRLRWPVKA